MKSTFLPGLLGLSVWWLILFLLWMHWIGLLTLVPLCVVLLVVAMAFRRHPQIATIWIPTVTICGLAAVGAIQLGVTALDVMQNDHPQSLYGSLSSCLFLLFAIPVGIAGVIMAAILIVSAIFRPVSFLQSQTVVASLNTLALLTVAYFFQEALLLPPGDPLIIQVLDSQQRPLDHVSVYYAAFETEPSGAFKAAPEKYEKMLTDEAGKVKLTPSRNTRQIVLELGKAGYGWVKATIVNNDVGMGEQGYQEIYFQVNDIKAETRRSYVSNKKPVEISMYLPSKQESSVPLKRIKFGHTWPDSKILYLHLKDGTMDESPGGELKFECLEKGDPRGLPQRQYRVTALAGAGLAPIRRDDSAQGILNESYAFSDLMRESPLEPYTETLKNGLPGSFYCRLRKGGPYALVEMGDVYRGPAGEIFLGTTSSRILLFDPKLEVK